MSKTRVDPDKLRQKLQYIRDSVRHLAKLREQGEERFLSDEIHQAAATRYLQVGIEAMIDAAHHILAREGLGLPKTYRQAWATPIGSPARSRPDTHPRGHASWRHRR